MNSTEISILRRNNYKMATTQALVLHGAKDLRLVLSISIYIRHERL